MKLLISIYLIINASFAAEIHIDYKRNFSKIAKVIEERFLIKYQIPKSLIHLREVKECKYEKLENVMKICLENKKGPKVISDPYIINALLSFGEL